MVVNLQRVISIPGFIGCVHDAMVDHPEKRVRRAAQRQIGLLEQQIGRAELGGYKLPKAIVLLDAIPVTPNNKPDRRKLREEAAGRRA